ncbi:MAG: 4-hydroxybenzoate 3-monooxygenase [Novosphingobium sp.]
MKTQVAIIGAGPAGLLLGHILRAEGIDCVVVERQSREHVLSRIRAGVLEAGTVALLDQLELAQRLHAEGIVENHFCLADGERLIRIDVAELTGKAMTVYGQTEVTRDLMDAAPSRGLKIIYEASDVALHDIESDAPYLTYGDGQRIDARFIAGCDGFHGPSRKVIPASVARPFEKVYPFGWLGVLADVPPCDELVYANHERGFALASMRSKTRSRYYVQVALDERLEYWSDERFWNELTLRLGPTLAPQIVRGPSIEKSIAPLRSFVFEPMRHGSLFLAGDAAHIVPPTGAKGLNLAASDAAYLSRALAAYFNKSDNDGIAIYSATALARVWKSERFSWQLTMLMHRFPDSSPFDRRMQLAELDYIAGSRAAQTAIAENYAGLPL